MRKLYRHAVDGSWHSSGLANRRLGSVLVLAVVCLVAPLLAEGHPSRPMAFRVSPCARFIASDRAVVSWETEQPGEAVVE